MGQGSNPFRQTKTKASFRCLFLFYCDFMVIFNKCLNSYIKIFLFYEEIVSVISWYRENWLTSWVSHARVSLFTISVISDSVLVILLFSRLHCLSNLQKIDTISKDNNHLFAIDELIFPCLRPHASRATPLHNKILALL